MSRQKRSGKVSISAKHVRITGFEIRCPAYRSLSCYARALLIEMRDLHNGRNNGEFYLSVREAAERLGCAPATAAKALQELEDKGWIKPSQKGSFRHKQKEATTWILTNEAHNGDLATKEYATWKN